MQPPLVGRHTRAASVFVSRAVHGDALARRLALRQRGGKVRRVRHGEPRAAQGVRPRALPRDLLLAGPEHQQPPRQRFGLAVGGAF
eukprot:4775090-Pyramimonas_sp.AAC.1